MVRIIQCLCPQRHCIMGVAYQPNEPMPSEEVLLGFKELIKEAIQNKMFDPWCGLCGSRDWRYEDSPSKFKTIQEAAPYLRALELEQAKVRRAVSKN